MTEDLYKRIWGWSLGDPLDTIDQLVRGLGRFDAPTEPTRDGLTITVNGRRCDIHTPSRDNNRRWVIEVDGFFIAFFPQDEGLTAAVAFLNLIEVIR